MDVWGHLPDDSPDDSPDDGKGRSKRGQKCKSFVIFTLFALIAFTLAFIIEKPIFQMYRGISPI
jgi:hypothetical protein